MTGAELANPGLATEIYLPFLHYGADDVAAAASGDRGNRGNGSNSSRKNSNASERWARKQEQKIRSADSLASSTSSLTLRPSSSNSPSTCDAVAPPFLDYLHRQIAVSPPQPIPSRDLRSYFHTSHTLPQQLIMVQSSTIVTASVATAATAIVGKLSSYFLSNWLPEQLSALFNERFRLTPVRLLPRPPIQPMPSTSITAAAASSRTSQPDLRSTPCPDRAIPKPVRAGASCSRQPARLLRCRRSLRSRRVHPQQRRSLRRAKPLLWLKRFPGGQRERLLAERPRGQHPLRQPHRAWRDA